MRASCSPNSITRVGRARGGEFVAPNWWMGMANRTTPHGQFTFTGMFSLDPATVGKAGYRELFHVGEVLDGLLLIDRQHPHDVFMQLAAVWRLPLTGSTGFTIAGGPADRRPCPRSSRLHAPRVCRRESDGSARPSHV